MVAVAVVARDCVRAGDEVAESEMEQKTDAWVCREERQAHHAVLIPSSQGDCEIIRVA